jgi:hypothetical protein
MEPFTKETFTKVIIMVKEKCYGQLDNNTKAIGKEAKWMDQGFSNILQDSY